MPAPTLRLGTRASPLARWQADWVAGQLSQRGIEVQMVPLTTHGDQDWGGPIGAIGTQGVFTKAIQRVLLAGEIDLAVHSLKDLPTEPVAGIVLAAVPERGPAGDVLVTSRAESWETLPPQAVVGTGSLRRRAQLWHARSDLVMHDVRGNVETRLAKLDAGQYDALVLAEAGLARLGLAGRITQILPRDLMLPAVGQGALGIEARQDDTATRGVLAPLNDLGTQQAVLAERAMLAALRGGCLAPVAAWGRREDALLHLVGVVLAADGSRRLEASGSAAPDQAEQLGQAVAEQLLSQGAGQLIEASRTVI
ncbi:MAG: hydroxymethylbilane synthase [Pirellulales bacterium]